MNIWKQHDIFMKKLRLLYDKASKQTQNELQTLLDTFSITNENLYNIADNNTKQRINTYIEQWKKQGLFKDNYFNMLANSIYRRTRVKNSEILELIIYKAYIQEQTELEEQEKKIMYEDADYYYQEGQKEVKKKIKPSILEEALFLYLLTQPSYNGLIYQQYKEATTRYNAQQIYQQAVLNIIANKENDINSIEFQNIINKQNNQRLCIKGDKISGAVDNQMIGLNNLAKVEGIKEQAGDNAQVRFIAVTDDKSTSVCQSMKDQLFYINKENTFYRMYGESPKDLRNEQIKCFGLVLGLNLPPIMHHFHFCRSSIVYNTQYKSKNVIKEYTDITTKELNKAKSSKAKVEEQYYINKNGVRYEVVSGSKNVVFKPSQEERECAKILSETFGEKVILLPKVNNPSGVKSAGYLFEGEFLDLKTIKETSYSINAISDKLKGCREQSDNFIIDITNYKYEMADVYSQIDLIYKSGYRDWVNKIYLMQDKKIIKIFERRK